MPTPLAGVRVLSLADQFPGPYAGMLLADLGADVIAVERPPDGDPTRAFPGHWEALNRNKRAVAVNLKRPGGLDAFLALVESADILVEGFRPGVADRLGIGARELQSMFPDLIYMSISAFGQDGPLRSRAAHDLSIQAAVGMVTSTEETAGTELPPLPLADISSAMFAVVGALVALLNRERSGHSMHIDLGMFDCLASWMGPQLVAALNGLGPLPYPPVDPGYAILPTADGKSVALSIAGEDHHWDALCEELGLDDLISQPENERARNSELVSKRLRRALEQLSAEDLERRLESRGIPFALANEFHEIRDDRQARDRETLLDLSAPGDGRTVTYVRQPLIIDGERSTISRPAPEFGEHTRSVFLEIGCEAEQIDSWMATGALVSH